MNICWEIFKGDIKKKKFEIYNMVNSNLRKDITKKKTLLT
jgi:hypothetical protein